MAQSTPTEIGDQFTSLEVIGLLPPHFEPSGHKRQKVRVRCACGQEFDILAYSLTRGNTTQCRQCSYLDMQKWKIGERYDKLVIQEFMYLDGSHRMAICQCDCGNKITLRASSLTKNMTNNCGCAHTGSWTGTGELATMVFNRIRQSAQIRGIGFSITCEEVWALYENQGRKCALSGLPIGFSPRAHGNHTASLDRKDSSKGYEEGNLQWVHKNVNQMKMDLPNEEYITLCKTVSEHQELVAGSFKP